MLKPEYCVNSRYILQNVSCIKSVLSRADSKSMIKYIRIVSRDFKCFELSSHYDTGFPLTLNQSPKNRELDHSEELNDSPNEVES